MINFVIGFGAGYVANEVIRKVTKKKHHHNKHHHHDKNKKDNATNNSVFDSIIEK